MDIEQPRSHYSQTQESLREGIVQKINQHFRGVYMSIMLEDIIAENQIDVEALHPETIRALCHYASVLAGEATNTGIEFSPQARKEWIENGYDSYERVIENEFIIRPRKNSYSVKRGPTYEKLTPYDIQRRDSKRQTS